MPHVCQDTTDHQTCRRPCRAPTGDTVRVCACDGQRNRELQGVLGCHTQPPPLAGSHCWAASSSTCLRWLRTISYPKSFTGSAIGLAEVKECHCALSARNTQSQRLSKLALGKTFPRLPRLSAYLAPFMLSAGSRSLHHVPLFYPILSSGILCVGWLHLGLGGPGHCDHR